MESGVGADDQLVRRLDPIPGDETGRAGLAGVEVEDRDSKRRLLAASTSKKTPPTVVVSITMTQSCVLGLHVKRCDDARTHRLAAADGVWPSSIAPLSEAGRLDRRIALASQER
jgi:hypothetical protein